jgi:peptidoglycan hydrolase-like protein with peptidoglycan-binding domain
MRHLTGCLSGLKRGLWLQGNIDNREGMDVNRSWLKRLAAGFVLLVAGGVVAGLVLSTGSPGTSEAASGTPAASGATTVEQRDLVETDTESGTLSYANSQTVYNRLSGTITWLPSVGQEIKPGQALFRVDGAPVVLMNGSTPAFRDLSAADSAGQDILELNRNLIALGFDPGGIVADDIWQPATTAGVDVLQASLGQTETGILTLGEVVFLPGRQLVSALEASLGSTGGAGAGASTTASSTGASWTGAQGSAEFVGFTRSASARRSPRPVTQPRPGKSSHARPKHSGPGRSPAGTSKQSGRGGKTSSLKALIALLEAEIAELKSHRSPSGSPSSHSPSGSPSASPSSSLSNPGGSAANGGGSGASASPILQTSSTQLVVTVDLDASKQSEAKLGEKVSVQMPAGNTVGGKIIGVSPVAQTSSSANNSNNNGSSAGGAGGSSSGSSATIPVTIALSSHQSGAGLDQAAVSVNFVQAVANHVLSVPVTALLATPGGGYAVQEAAAPHRLISVQTGLFAAGYVQISGAGLQPGLQVTDSQG